MEIYLDYNATTPVDPEVSRAMEPYLTHYFGNPSSMHKFGIETKKAIERSRQQVARLLKCQSHEVIFTSGGTESNNYALKGAAYALQHKGNHIITTRIEHPAVIEVCKYLETKGFEVTYLPVKTDGVLDPSTLRQAIKKNTVLISVMHANNEIGAIQPIKEIGQIAKEHHILFHTDAAQSTGKIGVDVKTCYIDLLSVAGHKLYAPKGVGALYIRDGVKLEKLIHGADHERDFRAGTENVLEIVGLGKACEIAERDLAINRNKMIETRDFLHKRIKNAFPGVKLNGPVKERLPNTISLSFPGVEANLIVNELAENGIAVSAGAACHTDTIDVSAVLKAINLEERFAMGTVRFSTGKHTTREEIEKASTAIIETVKKLGLKTREGKTTGDTKTYRLTQFTQGMGCACKLRPQELEKILKNMPVSHDPNILVDTRHSDDAAVYKITDEMAIVQTVDFFTPVVDDPYTFGAIAASNALSDIYAMGAEPLFALNIVGFPSSRLPGEVLKQILKGAHDIAAKAGISVLGGHTIDDPEPKFGMAVTGKVHPDKMLSNAGAKPGDAIILTKPIGTGILSTAVKRGLAEPELIQELNAVMSSLNKKAAEIMQQFPVNACTDVTGFGLLGHLNEIVTASKTAAEVHARQVPLIQNTLDYAAANLIPGGTYDNLDYLKNNLRWDEEISDIYRLILCDAQTSGGLLIILPEKHKAGIMEKLSKAGSQAFYIGRFTEKGNRKIQILNR